MLAVLFVSAPVFALNAVTQDDKSCNAQRAAFEEDVKTMCNQPAGIIQYVLINMADPMGGLSDEQVQDDAICYATFHVNGMYLVDFVRANADVFRQQVGEEERSGKGLDYLRDKALNFANRVEKISKQNALDNIASHDNDSWLVQYVLENLADPMTQLTDEKATPKAKVYKQLKVRAQPLLEFVRQQSRNSSTNVAEDLNTFAIRVESLSK